MQRSMRSPHTFHIPVMGTGFTIDTPLKVARFGISSVVSLVDDVLIEQVRKHWCAQQGKTFEPILDAHPDARARRITAYLNLLQELVDEQVDAMREEPFATSTDITRYFEWLPECPLKARYQAMLHEPEADKRVAEEARLRAAIVAGAIDVNIMSKLDRALGPRGEPRTPEMSDALSALRGFAESAARGSVVLSAGFNPKLYGYLASFDDFMPDGSGTFRKTITLKIGDFRSAEVQGRYLASRGLWISELRVESGLNCGGHAFESKPMGPVLAEIAKNKDTLVAKLFAEYTKVLSTRGVEPPSSPPPLTVTAQGGVGTSEEHTMLLRHYGLERVGWGSPFLLVPEVTNVDEETLSELVRAKAEDIELSEASPLGVRFWLLKTSPSERARRRRVSEGRPGSPCPKGFLATGKPNEVPLCVASRAYQKKKLAELQDTGASEEEHQAEVIAVTAKACICHDLGGGVTRNYQIDAKATPAICPGPNVAHFDRVATLEEMIGHIYGRVDLLDAAARPHMFITELSLYIDRLEERLTHGAPGAAQKLRDTIEDAFAYYHRLVEAPSGPLPSTFAEGLAQLRERLRALETSVQPPSDVRPSSAMSAGNTR